MWRCPQDQLLVDLPSKCGFCGLGIEDLESNGWNVEDFFEAVSAS